MRSDLHLRSTRLRRLCSFTLCLPWANALYRRATETVDVYKWQSLSINVVKIWIFSENFQISSIYSDYFFCWKNDIKRLSFNFICATSNGVNCISIENHNRLFTLRNRTSLFHYSIVRSLFLFHFRCFCSFSSIFKEYQQQFQNSCFLAHRVVLIFS